MAPLRYLVPPLLLAVYAVARAIDGSDGDHGPGLAWDVGHVAFLVAFLGFGVLTVDFWRRSPRPHAGVHVAALASLAGIGLFCWVIVTDLSPSLDQRASLPDPVMAVGPLLFIGGFVAALALHARQHGFTAWWAPPALVLAGLLAVGADLDLLPVTALAVGAGLLLAGRQESPPAPRRAAAAVR